MLLLFRLLLLLFLILLLLLKMTQKCKAAWVREHSAIPHDQHMVEEKYKNIRRQK